MAAQTGAPDVSAASPPPPPPPAGDQEMAEEKIEQVELANPEKVDSEKNEEKMEKSNELLKSQDEAEDKQVDPQTEAKQEEKADAPASEVPYPKEEDKEKAEKKHAELDPEEIESEAATIDVEPPKPAEEQVKVEIVEENLEEATEKGDELEASVEVVQREKERLEVGADKEQGEAEAVEEEEACKEVSVEEKRPSEEPAEAIQASDSLEAVLEHEKTSAAGPVEEEAEQKLENSAQEENLAEEFKALVLVDEPQLQAVDEKTELKEMVEENSVKDVGDEMTAKVEALQVDEVEKIEASQAEEEVVEKLEASKADSAEENGEEELASDKEVESEEKSEVAEEDEKTIEEIKPRESLGALMKMEEENQEEVAEGKTIENSSNVVAVEQAQAEDKDVRESMPEIADNDVPEATQDLSEPKEVIQVKEELAPEVKKAGDQLEQNKQSTEEGKLEKEVVASGSVHAESITVTPKEVTENPMEAVCARTDAELPSEKKIEENKQEREITAPIENGTGEGKTGDLAACEENKDPEAVEGKSPSEPIKERALEMAKPEEKSNKDVDEAKDTQDQPKGEASAKPVSKQSNNLISKMKHSLVKAKKAIIGKSPSSKSISTSTGDIKVK